MDSPEIVDPLDQLVMSLAWHDDYTEEYKRRVVTEAIQFVYRKWQEEG